MKNMCWVVHAILEGPVQVRERFGTAAEAHPLAEVIPSIFAVITVITHNPCLDGNTLAGYKIFDPRTNSGYYACRLMTEDEWSL
jgi:hypothetical protein